MTRLRETGRVGHLKLKLLRDECIRGTERIIEDSNEPEKNFTRLGQNIEWPAGSRAAVRVYLEMIRDSDAFGIEQLAEVIENNQMATATVDGADEVDWAPEEPREL